MRNRIIERINEVCQDLIDELIIVGVSGGADSIFLTRYLYSMGYKIIVAHFNHQLRANAEEDAKFVEEFANQCGLPFELGMGNVQNYSISERKSIEEAARILRYDFLYSIARKYNSRFIAVAHNADDQVETVMMHLIRGSGLSGLTGMKNKTIIDEFGKDITIIRPLLSIWRTEIEAFLKKENITFCQDETNFELKYARNRLRNELIPYIAKKYPNFKQQIWQTADLLLTDKEIIDSQIEQCWSEFVDHSKSGIIRCDRDGFLTLGLGKQRHLLRKIAFYLKPSIRDISFESIQRGINGIVTLHSGKVDLEGNLIIELADKEFYVFDKKIDWVSSFFPQIVGEKLFNIEDHKSYDFSTNWQLKTTIIEKNDSEYQIEKSNPLIIDLDISILENKPLKITVKKPGDRFFPFGMENGEMKVSDFFINEKIPKSARANWPILVDSDGKIIWIMGLRASNDYKITSTSEKIIRLEMFQK